MAARCGAACMDEPKYSTLTHTHSLTCVAQNAWDQIWLAGLGHTVASKLKIMLACWHQQLPAGWRPPAAAPPRVMPPPVDAHTPPADPRRRTDHGCGTSSSGRGPETVQVEKNELVAGDFGRLKACCIEAFQGRLNKQEQLWMSPEVLSIFWRARDTDQERQAVLVKALEWRTANRSFLCGDGALRCTACEANAMSHDARLFGSDADGDFVFANCFALPHDLSPSAITAHMACLFERALQSDTKGSTGGAPRRWSWVIDLYGFGLRHMDPRTSVKLLELMQVAYRGRLKRILIVDAPTVFWGLWRAIKPFISRTTEQLIEFVEWEAPAAKRYLELFGGDISAQLVCEGRENRDSTTRAKKRWTPFYAGAALECVSIYDA
jgi:hypothetical protein